MPAIGVAMRTSGVVPATSLTLLLLAGGFAYPGSAPAATTCNVEASWTQTSTTAVNRTCGHVQARIDRYVSNFPEKRLGPVSTTQSRVTATEGVNAGNAFQGSSPTTGQWSGWVWIH
jgi:hypothetical protein